MTLKIEKDGITEKMIEVGNNWVVGKIIAYEKSKGVE